MRHIHGEALIHHPTLLWVALRQRLLLLPWGKQLKATLLLNLPVALVKQCLPCAVIPPVHCYVQLVMQRVHHSADIEQHPCFAVAMPLVKSHCVTSVWQVRTSNCT